MVAVLSFSSADFSPRCEEVVEAMRRAGLSGDVTPNRTLVDGGEEQGCRVVLAGEKKEVEALWKGVREKCNLTCGHAKIEKTESGCILDVLRPSLCPGNCEAQK